MDFGEARPRAVRRGRRPGDARRRSSGRQAREGHARHWSRSWIVVVVVVFQTVFLRLLLGPLESCELFVFSHGLRFIISTLARDGIVVGLLILVIIISLPQPDLLGWISMRRYSQQYASNIILNNFGRPHRPQVEVAVAVIHALTKPYRTTL